MTASNWIPVHIGFLSWECQRCGLCCRNGVVELPDWAQVMVNPDTGRCGFLTDSGCSSYGTRPPFCKIFPFNFIDGVAVIWSRCPGIGKGPLVSREQLDGLAEVGGWRELKKKSKRLPDIKLPLIKSHGIAYVPRESGVNITDE